MRFASHAMSSKLVKLISTLKSENDPNSADLFNILVPSLPQPENRARSKRSTVRSVFATSERTKYSSAPGGRVGYAPSSRVRSKPSNSASSRIQDGQ